MNSQDYRNLQEAYLDVYEQEEVLDEISIGMKRRAADASVDKVNKAGERFRSSTSVDVQPYLMKKKDKAEAQHLRLAKAAESYDQQLDEISIGMKRRAADASVDKVKKAGERFRSSTSVDVQPYLMNKKDKAEAQHLRLAKAAESYDLYDIILSHLIDEGYADTQEAAERIMVNMSEDWRESIVETRSII